MPYIPLTKGFAAKIDEIDADLMQLRYWASVNGRRHVYAQRHAPSEDGRFKRHLHRDIGERIYGGPIPKGYVVDHINGDTLDHTRANLRIVLHKRNIWNQTAASPRSKSGVIGVRRHRDKWQAYICTGLKMHTLGSFDTMEEARTARLDAEAKRLEAA